MTYDLTSRVQIGCCGWPEARAKYYSHFPIIELQQTFYQPPSLERAQKWRQEAPANFVFALKAWQLITHPAESPTYRRLKAPIAREERENYGFFRPSQEVWAAWEETAAVARALAAKVIVFQCPPSFAPTAENKANLRAFFQRVERWGWLLAWEPRGRWTATEVRELCQGLELMHCVDPFLAEPTYGSVAYFRLHGRGGYNYRYSDEELGQLREMCWRQLEQGRSLVYCLFNNVYMLPDGLRFQRLLPKGSEQAWRGIIPLPAGPRGGDGPARSVPWPGPLG